MKSLIDKNEIGRMLSVTVENGSFMPDWHPWEDYQISYASQKKLGGGVRLALAQYRELAAFSQFASDLDDATKKQLDRGQRVTELMKQNQYLKLLFLEQKTNINIDF